jgi:hypothetical protein
LRNGRIVSHGRAVGTIETTAKSVARTSASVAARDCLAKAINSSTMPPECIPRKELKDGQFDSAMKVYKIRNLRKQAETELCNSTEGRRAAGKSFSYKIYARALGNKTVSKECSLGRKKYWTFYKNTNFRCPKRKKSELVTNWYMETGTQVKNRARKSCRDRHNDNMRIKRFEAQKSTGKIRVVYFCY